MVDIFSIGDRDCVINRIWLRPEMYSFTVLVAEVGVVVPEGGVNVPEGG